MLCSLRSARAAASPADVDRLIARAHALGLDENPHWLKLLHYHRHGLGRSSDIDGGYFFLSPKGKYDPKAELDATVRALLSEADLSPPLERGLEVAAMHPLCKFRARLHFLKDHLDLPDSLLPDVDCGRFEAWRAALRPKGATLIFASSYLNNPASSFGHTFLRLDTRDDSTGNSILNYGVTYAASVPPGDAFAFVYKGLLGFYRASYGIVPYYFSLQKYSDLESRDIWEYPLALTQRQTDYLLEHVWEVGAAWMGYYFFDENCSYDIITLLDAADPGWDLSSGLGWGAVVPAETVKLLLDRGLVKSRRWRPSLLTSFRLRSAAMRGRQREALRAMVRTAAKPDSLRLGPALPRGERAAALDAALDYVQYRKRRSDDSDGTWARRQRQLLLARVSLPVGSPQPPLVPDRIASPPEEGHGPHRFGAAAGVAGYRPALDIGLRFAYHDLNARESGFLAGSQIEALRLRLRVACARSDCRDGSPEVSVRDGDFLSILSLTDMDDLRHPMSWGLRAGYDSRPRAGRAGRFFVAEAGAGASSSWTTGDVEWKPFLLAQARARAFILPGTACDAGPQGLAGLRASFGGGFSVLAENRWYFPVDARRDPLGRREGDWTLEARLSLGRDADARLSLADRDGVGEAFLGWNGYF